ncbi:MAG: tRNA-(ms[2]io[6]A)-hydroxylase [Chitinophagales bacterium]
MLGLKLSTDPRWVNLAEKSIHEILTDHAYCEQKAASSGISLIVLYPDLDDLVRQVTQVVDEEWGHFRMVLDELKSRGLQLGFPRKDMYVLELNKRIRNNGTYKEKLMDRLLLSALIEARSCERFKLLSQEISDLELRSFYKKLMISEAGHYKLFLDLAIQYLDKPTVMKRWDEYLQIEEEVLRNIDLRGDRMH